MTGKMTTKTDKSCMFELFSDMNPDHEVYILTTNLEHADDICQIADKAYEEWWGADEDTNPEAYYDAIGSYISYMLAAHGYEEGKDYGMEFGTAWSEDYD